MFRTDVYEDQDVEAGWESEAESSNEESVLVPGRHGVLRVGLDDDEIQRQHILNLSEISEETTESNEYYIATVEKKVVWAGETDTTINHPQNILIAPRMIDAIALYERENGKRLWLPLHQMNKFESQIGLTRPGHALVHLQKIRKDLIIKKTSHLQ